MKNEVPGLALLGALAAAAAATAQPPQDHPHHGGHHGDAAPAAEASDAGTGHGDTALRHEGPADHSFADAEAWAERFESAERDEWQMPARVVAALALEPGDDVADIGSGTGYFSRRFAAEIGAAGTVYASDVEPAMAEYVRRRADEDGQRNLVPVLASYDDPRLPDGAIDLVFICNTWHHIQDRVDYARRLAGDLAAGGRVTILDFVEGELPVGPSPEHKLSAEEVAAEFREAGFEQVAAHDFLPYQYLLEFAPRRPPGGGEAAAGQPRPAGSPQAAGLAAWSFLIGEWRVDQRRFSFEGELLEENGGSASFTHVLGGQRIQEHLRIERADQVTDVLHTFVYDPRAEEVEIARTDSGHFGFSVIVGSLSPERLELREKHPRPGSDVTRRFTYVKLGPDRFRRTLEFSTDGGESWFVRSEESYTRAG